jgi:hypothetical protein
MSTGEFMGAANCAEFPRRRQTAVPRRRSIAVHCAEKVLEPVPGAFAAGAPAHPRSGNRKAKEPRELRDNQNRS